MQPPQVTFREPLRPGLEGLKRTVDRIRAAIARGGKSFAVRREAELMTRYVAPHNYRGEINAIFEGVLGIDQPPYRKDPVNVELLRGAQAGGTSRGVDCDDIVIRAGSLLEALGHPVEVEVMGRERPKRPEQARFTHVRLRVWDGKARQWIPFDPVLRDPRRRPNAKLGDEAPAGVVARFPVLVQAQPVGELGDFWSDLNNFGKSIDITNPKNSVLRNVVSAIPGVGSTIVHAADSLAAGRRAITKATGIDPSKLLGNALGIKDSGGGLNDSAIDSVYRQVFGHGPTAARMAAWRGWAAQNHATPAKLVARMQLPLYDKYDARGVAHVPGELPPPPPAPAAAPAPARTVTVAPAPVAGSSSLVLAPTPQPTSAAQAAALAAPQPPPHPTIGWSMGEKLAAAAAGAVAVAGIGLTIAHFVK